MALVPRVCLGAVPHSQAPGKGLDGAAGRPRGMGARHAFGGGSPVRLSIEHSLDGEQVTIDTTFVELIESLRVHRITPGESKADKESVPLFSPAFFPTGFPKTDAHVQGVSFGVIDLDHLNAEKESAVLEILGGLPFPWYLYTTHSHGLGGEAALRILVEFLQPVAGSQWEPFWSRFKAIFERPSIGLFVDPKCRNAARFYFVPSCPQSRSHLARFERSNLPPGTPPFDPSSLLYNVSGSIVVPGTLIPRGDSLGGARIIEATGGGTRHVSRAALETLQARLSRKKLRAGKTLKAVLDGVAWGEKGERDTLLFQLAGAIAAEFPDGNVNDIADHFTLSLGALNDSEYSIELVRDKLHRAQVRVAEEKEAKELTERLDRATRIKSAFIEFGQDRDTPYTETEIAGFATLAGVSITDFARRWILQSGSAFYVYCNARYIGPFGREDISSAARKYLAPAPIELDETSPGGKKKTPIRFETLLANHGTHVRRIVVDLNSDVTVLDTGESTLIEATCPVRGLESRFDPLIDEWLRIMAGERYNLIREWLSWLTTLDQPCAALYLQGASGTGKSLFAKGVARIWTTENPTTMAQALHPTHNESLCRCPLVFADEKMPDTARGVKDTGRLREFIQEESRPLMRKYLPDASMRGATRTVIAANNLNLLHTGEHLTADDIQAIADRIIHVPIAPEAGEWLAARREQIAEWVSGDRIAMHALWHVAHYPKAANPPRFLVQAPRGALHLEIGTGTSLGGAVAHWLVSWILEPSKLWNGRSLVGSAGRITYNVETREVYVSANCLTDNWETYRTNYPIEKANIRAVGLALGAISTRRGSYLFSGGRSNIHVVPLEHLLAWGEESGFHPDTVREAAGKVPVEMNKAQTRGVHAQPGRN